MNQPTSPAGITQQTSVLATNKVIRNTYLLLSMTLAFSAVTAGISMAFNLPHPGMLITLVGYFGLLFLTYRFRDSAMGLAMVFALTGFMGFTLGPILNAYLQLANGAQLVAMAMSGTAITFFAMSAWAMTSKRDFVFWCKYSNIKRLIVMIFFNKCYFRKIKFSCNFKHVFGRDSIFEINENCKLISTILLRGKHIY